MVANPSFEMLQFRGLIVELVRICTNILTNSIWFLYRLCSKTSPMLGIIISVMNRTILSSRS